MSVANKHVLLFDKTEFLASPRQAPDILMSRLLITTLTTLYVLIIEPWSAKIQQMFFMEMSELPKPRIRGLVNHYQ